MRRTGFNCAQVHEFKRPGVGGWLPAWVAACLPGCLAILTKGSTVRTAKRCMASSAAMAAASAGSSASAASTCAAQVCIAARAVDRCGLAKMGWCSVRACNCAAMLLPPPAAWTSHKAGQQRKQERRPSVAMMRSAPLKLQPSFKTALTCCGAAQRPAKCWGWQATLTPCRTT